MAFDTLQSDLAGEMECNSINSTHREMRDVRRFRLGHGADDFPGVRLRLHRLFLSDLTVIHPALRAWQEKLAGAPSPFDAVRTPSPMLVPGCNIVADM
jgi:hypothetical protein